MEKLKKTLRLSLLLAWLFCYPAFLLAPFFEPPTFSDSSAYIKSWVESASGFKSLAEGTRVVEQVLNRDVKEWRVKQIAKIDSQLKEVREKKAEGLKKLEIPKKYLEAELFKLRHAVQMAEASGTGADDSAKKILRLYDERLQVMVTTSTVWITSIGFLEEHLGLLQHHADDVIYLGADLGNKVVYRIDEYNHLEYQIELVDEQIKEVEDARPKVERERNGLQTILASLYKESTAKERELKALKNDAKNDLLEAEYNLLKDKETLFELRLQKSALEKSKIEDEITLLKYQKSRLVELLGNARRSLAVDSDDVTKAKVEKDEQDAFFIHERTRVETVRNEKEIEYERARQRHEATKTQVASLRALGKDATPEGVMLQARELLDKNMCGALAAQIAFLDLDISFASAELSLKNFNLKSLEMRFKLTAEDLKIAGWIDEISAHKKLLEDEVETLIIRKNKANSALPKMQEELDRLKKKQLELSDGGSAVFLGYDDALKSTMHYIFEAKEAVRLQVAQTQRFEVRAAELLRLYQRTLKKYISLLGELEAKRVSVDIWRRAPRGLTLALLLKAGDDIQTFAHDCIAGARDMLNFRALLSTLSLGLLAGFFLTILVFWAGRLSVRMLLVLIRRRLQLFISYQKGTFVFWYLNVVLLFVDALLRQFHIVFPTVFSYLHLRFCLDYMGVVKPLYNVFLLSSACLVVIGLLMYVAADFIAELRVLNARLSYFFFSERSQRRILLLLNIMFHSSAIAIPLRAALVLYGARYESLPILIFAMYSLAVTIVLAFFFEKDDFINLVTGRSPFWLAVREMIDDYFYPVFFFALSLCLLANPYIGYVRLAWYLAMFIPSSVAVMWFAAKLYGMLRNQVVWIFIEERDDELAERFEHAKVYYGFFVTMSFCALLFFMVGVLSKIWGFQYSFGQLWTALSEEWVVPIGQNAYVGLLHVLTLYAFLTGGYLASTCVNRFVLAKIFDVFGTEPGAQNTFLRIFHVVVLITSVMLGCTFVGLAFVVIWLMPFIVLVGGFGAKDLVADFVAGLLILLERQIEIGHFITAENMKGTVHKISARSTIIRTQQNYFVVIPNRTLISHSIINWGAGRFSVGFELTVTVGYESDPEVIIAILRKILNAHALILRVPAPSVRLENFSQHGADYFVRAFVSIRKVREQWEVAGDIRVAVYKAFRDRGIVFPYPRLIMYKKNNQPDDAGSFFKVKFDETPDDAQGRRSEQ